MIQYYQTVQIHNYFEFFYLTQRYPYSIFLCSLDLIHPQMNDLISCTSSPRVSSRKYLVSSSTRDRPSNCSKEQTLACNLLLISILSSQAHLLTLNFKFPYLLDYYSSMLQKGGYLELVHP